MKYTQSAFYSKWPVAPESKEQRLILDLRDSEFSWDDIDLVFLALDYTPYSTEWNLQLEETA